MSKRKLCGSIVVFMLLVSVMAVRFFIFSAAGFQLDSEDLANSMIAASIADMDMSGVKFGMHVLSYDGVIFRNHGFGKDSADKAEVMYLVRNSPELDSSKLQIVSTRRQQIGIQGWAAYWFSRIYHLVHVNPKYFYHALRMLNALLLALVLTAMAFQLRKAYETLFAVCFWCMCLLSVWITNFAPKLYWATFTWFLPMLFGLMCMNYPEHRSFLYLMVFAGVALKSLCGYEYMTSIMMCAVVFPASEYFACTSLELPRKKLMFRITLGAGLSALAGFIAVLVFHAYIRGDGSVLQGLNEIYHADVLRRTFGTAGDFPAAYTDSLNASILRVLAMYLFSIRSVLLITFCILTVASAFAAKFRHHLQVRRDVSLLVLSFLSSISWFVLGKSHSYIHTHMNYVLWQMPFVPVAAYVFLKQRLSVLVHDREEFCDKGLSLLRRIFFLP